MSRLKPVGAFDEAAPTYNAHAGIQQAVAQQLVWDVAQHLVESRSPVSVLDVCCGTGLVTREINLLLPNAEIWALDAAPSMLEETRKAVPRVRTIEADAQNFGLDRKVDFIISSMGLQWMQNPFATLEHWRTQLTPGGIACIAVPVEIPTWVAFCASHGIENRLIAFPKEEDFRAIAETLTVRDHTIVYPNPRAFLQGMKQTGAHTPKEGSSPTRPGALKKILKETEPLSVTWKILYLTVKNGPC